MLAMVINDDAGCLDARGVRAFFASMLAPTGPKRFLWESWKKAPMSPA